MKAEAERIDVFQAVSHPLRRAILQMLRDGKSPAMELAKSFDVTPGAVSQHLRILKDARLVSERRVGRQRIYQLHPRPLREVRAWICEFEAFWEQKIDALGKYLEREHGKNRD